MIEDIQAALKTSSLIASKQAKYKFFSFPDTDTFTGLYIIVNPVTPPKPTDYTDNIVYKAIEQLYQINVWTKSYADSQAVANEVRDVLLREYHFIQDDGAPLEFDKSTGIYNDARRYRCKKTIN